MLYDKNFLLELDQTKNKIIYAKVTALSFDELPITAIEGRVTQGSINIDGASAVRRSCSLSLVAQDFDYSDYSWGLNTKFKLEIGVRNFINSRYPDIIWFNQGIYVITSFNTARSTSNFTISLQGKDKMCLLNGEVSGTIGVQTDFGTIEEEDSQGVWTIRSIPIPEIIKNLVHSYGGEPYHNIIIKDLNTYGLELLEYRYDNVDLILYRKKNSNTYINAALGNNRNKRFMNIKNGDIKTISQFDDEDFETLTDAFVVGDDYPTFIEVDSNGNPKGEDAFVFTRIKYGETAGYRMTDLTYAGDLIANVGESITSILDKIKNMLVEFEYFYDVDGRFVFQKKQSFINTLWQPTADSGNINTEYEREKEIITTDLQEALDNLYKQWSDGEIESENDYFEQMREIKNYYNLKLRQCSNLYKVADGNEQIQESLALSSTTAYDFHGGELITSFNNNPNLLNLKNDYSIWGERTSVSGAAIPIHLRYAIDVKPTEYATITLTESDKEEIKEYNEKYGTTLKDDQVSTLYSTQFPLYKCSSCGSRRIQPITEQTSRGGTRAICPVCRSNSLVAEKYKYVADWREILYIMATDYFRYNTLDNFEIRVREANPNLYPTGRTGYEQYYTDIQVCWRQLYNNELGEKIKIATENIAKYSAEVENYAAQVVEQEKVLVAANKQLTAASANPDSSQDVIDNLHIQAMEEAQTLRDIQNNLNQSQYQLDQNKEKLETYQTNIENYYQIDEVPQTGAGTAYYTLLDDVSIFDDENIQMLPTYSTDGKVIADVCFHIPKSYISTVSEPASRITLSLLYSPKDNLYLKMSGTDDSIYHCRYYNIPRLYWNKNVYTAPNTLNYWFDFLDTEGELSQFNVKAIGSRTKAINETTVKSIYFRETPTVIYGTPEGEGLSGYKYININKSMMENMFTISAQGKSAKDRLDELLYAHGYCSESATVSAIPIYYLQPNSRIHISDPETNLDGDYIVSKITIPLSYNGTMQLTTTKAAETLFL